MNIFFIVCGVIGAVLYLIYILSTLSGLDFDADFGFTLFTAQAVSSFLIVFCLFGLGLMNIGISPIGSFAGGFIVGSITFYSMTKITAYMKNLQSNGNITKEDIINSTGTVYTTITETGIGQVIINIKNRSREYDAISYDNEILETETPVKVTNVLSNNVVAVKRIKNPKN